MVARTILLTTLMLMLLQACSASNNETSNDADATNDGYAGPSLVLPASGSQDVEVFLSFRPHFMSNNFSFFPDCSGQDSR